MVGHFAAWEAMEKGLSDEMKQTREDIIKTYVAAHQQVDDQYQYLTAEAQDQVDDVEDVMKDAKNFAGFLQDVKTTIQERRTSSDVNKFVASYQNKTAKYCDRKATLYPPDVSVLFDHEWNLLTVGILIMAFVLNKMLGLSHLVTCVLLLTAMTIFYEFMCFEARRTLKMANFGVHGGVDTVHMPLCLKCIRGFMIIRIAMNLFYDTSWFALAVAVDADTATSVMQFLTVGMYASLVFAGFTLMMICLAGVLTIVECPKSIEQIFQYLQTHIMVGMGYYDRVLYYFNKAQEDINYIKVHVATTVAAVAKVHEKAENIFHKAEDIFGTVESVATKVAAPVVSAVHAAEEVGGFIENAAKSVASGLGKAVSWIGHLF